MMTTFETSALKILQRTPTTRSIRFCRPKGFEYLPGQFITLMLDGQQKNGDGNQRSSDFESNAIKKPLSLSSSPSEDFLEVTKRLSGHEFSNAYLSVKEGECIRFSGPYGGFSFQGEYKKVAMLSGGIGITPLRSMIKYCTDMSLDTDILLLYSNRNEEDIPFKDEFQSLQEKNRHLKVISTLTRPDPEWKGRTGRIDAALIKECVPDYAERIFFSSGPSAMVDAMLSALQQMGLPQGQMRREYFPGYD